MESTTEHAAEGDPLKREEDGADAGTAADMMKKKSCKEGVGFSKLTHWRTAVFFLSLFLCLTVVFAFSFIIPCPVRPQYLITWNKTVPGAVATYDFLALEHASDDKVMDVLFVVKGTEGTQNKSCDDAGLSSPCVFLVAVDGTDGETLWERPLEAELHWAQCGLDKDAGRNWDCLVSHSDQITAVNKLTGNVTWRRPHPAGLHSVLPVLTVPDLDADGVSDVVLVASDHTQTQVVLVSGKNGAQIGSTVFLESSSNHLLHRTTHGSYYVLLQKDSGLFGFALWRILAKAGLDVSLQKDKNWEEKADATSGLVPVYESGGLTHVVRPEASDVSSDLLLVAEKEVVLLHGDKMQVQWRFNSSSVISAPSFGHFNKDERLDVVVEQSIGNYTKKIVILDGGSGVRLWDVDLVAGPDAPGPASILTTNSFSVFMFWGLMLSDGNFTVPFASESRSFMLHPLYSQVLLESANVTDHIVTFKATLMERGRHAAYFLLSGPVKDGDDGGGVVVLRKQKLKQDVPDSKVLRIGSGGTPDTNEDIKEAFNRLRFSS